MYGVIVRQEGRYSYEYLEVLEEAPEMSDSAGSSAFRVP